MKNSGIEWIGEIPNDWKIERLQWYLTEIKESNNPIQTDQVLSLTNKRGVIPYEEKGAQGNNAKENHADYKLAYPHTLVLNSMNVLIGSVGICDYFGCVSPVYYVFKPNKSANLEFINYIFQTEQFQKELRRYANGIMEIRLRLSSADILKRYIGLPLANIQSKIVDHLNKKCSQIDALILNQERQIEKLKQYKQSLITEVVTKGLDPTVPLKDSGVEWIGKIPETFEIRRGKAVLKLLDRPVCEDDEVITCFRNGEVTLRKNRREEGFTFSEKECGYQGINIGDLVVHGMDGFAGAIGISDSRGKGSPILIVCDSSENKKYLVYYLRTLAYREIFLALSTGIRVRSCDLRWNKLAILPFVIPKEEIQREIVSFLDSKCAGIDKIIVHKQSKIEKLNQYKKSLIYEYVTGKKEVV